MSDFQESGYPKPISFLENDETKIVRYMSFAKLLDLIFHKQLFFAFIDTLSDNDEGRYLSYLDSPWGQVFKEMSEGREALQRAMKENDFRKQFVDGTREWFAVNSWTLEHADHYALWRIYCPNGEGVSLETTKKKLAEAIDDEFKEYLIQANVKYQHVVPDPKSNHSHYFRKSFSYEYESEFRIGCDLLNPNIEKSKMKNLIDHKIKFGGFNIGIKSLSFIEKINVSPFGGKWLEKILKKIKLEYKCDFAITISTISER